MLGLVLVLALPQVAASPRLAPTRPAPVRPAPSRPGLSWADADSFNKTLETFERARPKSPGNATVSDGQVNSYLNLTMAGKLPNGLENPDLHFDKDRIVVTADVDFDQMRRNMPAMSSLNPLAYLGGRLALTLRGRLQTPQEGFGAFEFEQARLGPVSLPTTLLAQMVAASTKSAQYPQGFDVLSPFRLPYALKRVRVQPGHIEVEY